jgi:hypothetical protein
MSQDSEQGMTDRIEEDNRRREEKYWKGGFKNSIMSPNGLVHDNYYIGTYGEQQWEIEKKKQNEIIRANQGHTGGRVFTKKPIAPIMATEQHFPLFYDVLDNPEFRNGLMKKGQFRTYVWIGRFIVRGEMKNDPHHLYQNYYQKGGLAACVPTRVIAKALEIGKSTAADHIKALSDAGIIKCRTIQGKQSFDGQKYVICIFGTHKEGKEHWYIQDVYGVSGK